MKGGEAIASGGYGCVFYPALKCKNRKTRYDGASKLLKTSAANDEISETKRIIPILSKDPNYSSKVLLPQELCSPAKLDNNDMINVDLKCNKFANSIKNKLSSFKILQMPMGGVDLEKYLRGYKVNMNFVHINNQIRQLIKFIHIFNKQGLLHLDIKASNILIDKEDNNKQCKIIDWGLASVFKTHKQNTNIYDDNFIDTFEWKPIQFNVLPSNILFSEFFTEFIVSNKKSYTDVNKLAVDIKTKYNKYKVLYADGHMKNLIDFIQIIMKHKNLMGQAEDAIFSYIAEVCKYMMDRVETNNIAEYFNKIFMHNNDIWGILTCYFGYLNIPDNNFLVIDQNDIKEFKLNLADILWKHMMGNPVTKISINELLWELGQLNNYWVDEEASSIYLSSSSENIKNNKDSDTKLHIDADVEKPSNFILSNRKDSINKIIQQKQPRNRCPRGTRKNKLTGNCEEVNKKIYKICSTNTRKNHKGVCIDKNKISRKRCPNGQRRNNKGECIDKNKISRKRRHNTTDKFPI